MDLVLPKERTRKTNDTPLKLAVEAVYQRLYNKRLQQRVKFINSLPNHVMPTETDIDLIARQQGWGTSTKKLITKVAKSWAPTTTSAMTVRQQKLTNDEQTRMTKTGYKKSPTMMKTIDRHCRNQDWPNLVIIEKALNAHGVPIGRGVVTTVNIKQDAIMVDYHHTLGRTITRQEVKARKDAGYEGQGFVVFGENGLDTYDATLDFCQHDNHKSKLFFICIHLNIKL